MEHWEICKGCPKSHVEFCCSIYKDPTKAPWIRQGEPCPFNPPEVESKKKKFINPLKQSKRRNKR